MKLSKNSKVFYITESHTGTYEYIFARFPDAFIRLGCEVKEFDPGISTFDDFRRELDHFKPDVIFCLLRHTWAINKVAQFLDLYHPVVALNWFQEDPNFVNSEIILASKSFDFWFTQDPNSLKYWKTKAFFSPHAFEETLYYDRNLNKEFDVSFVGNLGHKLSTEYLWPYMLELSKYKKKACIGIERPMGISILPNSLERIIRSVKLRPIIKSLPFWSCSWENPDNELEKAVLVNKSKIHFCINRVRGYWEDSVKELYVDYPLDKHGFFCQTKGRLFHATGAAALAITDKVPGLETLFDINKEVITYEFNDFEDLNDKLRWYIKNDSARDKIRFAGYKRAHRDHTFVARIGQIFDTINSN